jgi:hypothetical protein
MMGMLFYFYMGYMGGCKLCRWVGSWELVEGDGECEAVVDANDGSRAGG